MRVFQGNFKAIRGLLRDLVGASVLKPHGGSIRALPASQSSCLIHRRFLQFSCYIYKPAAAAKVHLEACERPLQTRPSRRIQRSTRPPGYHSEVLSPACRLTPPVLRSRSLHSTGVLLPAGCNDIAKLWPRPGEAPATMLNGRGEGTPECRVHRSRRAPRERRWPRRRGGPRACRDRPRLGSAGSGSTAGRRRTRGVRKNSSSKTEAATGTSSGSEGRSNWGLDELANCGPASSSPATPSGAVERVPESESASSSGTKSASASESKSAFGSESESQSESPSASPSASTSASRSNWPSSSASESESESGASRTVVRSAGMDAAEAVNWAAAVAGTGSESVARPRPRAAGPRESRWRSAARRRAARSRGPGWAPLHRRPSAWIRPACGRAAPASPGGSRWRSR